MSNKQLLVPLTFFAMLVSSNFGAPMVSNKKLQKSHLKSWTEEKNSAYLYRIAAEKESNPTYRALFLKLAEEANNQAITWENELKKLAVRVPEPYQPSLRARIVGQLIRYFGPRQIRSILAAMKVRGMSVYLKTPFNNHPMPVSLEDVGQRHQRAGNANNLRAAVFGVNDGLVSNASLIMGMAGAHVDNKIIILSGIAGLLAGAFSMAAGEFVSVRSQREMFEYQIDLERKELELYPAEETAELALIYEARGLSKSEAFNISNLLMRDPKHALDVLAREELGINPDDLVSPWGAAISSFFSFAFGAVIPLLPFFFHERIMPLATAISLTALALFIVGATMSLFTGRSAIKSGLRMFLIGLAAGAITYIIGNILGVNLS